MGPPGRMCDRNPPIGLPRGGTVASVREIGVGELKTRLSEVLREVGAGEELRVTLRGQAVADIVPVDESRGNGDPLGGLVAAGKVAPPSRPRPRRAPRLAIAKRSASAAVVAEREAER